MRNERELELIERQREHFNSIAERYRSERTGPNHLRLKEVMWSAVLGDITRFHGRTIEMLEPMCGFCDGLEIAKTYLTSDIIYRGYDYSDAVISSVREARPQLDIWQADATAYQPQPNSTDLIMLIGGLHHVPEHARHVLTNLAPALRPGGLFINFEPTWGNPLFRAARDRIYSRNSLFDEKTERAFKVDHLLAMFVEAGLSPVKITFPGLLSYVLYYNPDAFPFLNIGRPWMVDVLFGIDRLFYRNFIGRYLSFATLSIWERPS